MAEIKKSSSSSKKSSGSDRSRTLKVVTLRNRFFYMLYKNSLVVFLASFATCVIAILFLLFFAREPVPPQYIPINADGTLISLAPLSEEKPEAEVQKFAIDGINKLFKYDYVNYSEQIQNAVSSYFTADGYNEYLDEYFKTDTLQAIKENKWIVTVSAKTVPTILNKGLVNGVYTWEIKTNVQIMYVGEKGKIQNGDIYLRIVRNSVINNPAGLGISKAIFKEIR